MKELPSTVLNYTWLEMVARNPDIKQERRTALKEKQLEILGTMPKEDREALYRYGERIKSNTD